MGVSGHFYQTALCFIARLADQYVAHKATNKYWNTGIGLVAHKATGVPKSDPKIGKIQKYVSILKYANWLADTWQINQFYDLQGISMFNGLVRNVSPVSSHWHFFTQHYS